MADFHDKDALAPHRNAGHCLIPLHRWDAVDQDANGKTRKKGKAPIDRDWTNRPYDAFDADGHMSRGNNVGVRLTAEQLVIDVDPRNDTTVNVDSRVTSYVDFMLWHGLDPDTMPTVVTGSGGLHHYLRKPADVPVVDGLKEFPGVEFKTKGRQVVAAGSVHPETGRRYVWDALSAPPEDAPAAPLALLDAIARPKVSVQTAEAGEHTPEQLAAMLDGLDPENYRDHDSWFQLMQACHHATAGAGREEFLEWSGRDPVYADDAPVVGMRWDSLQTDKAGGALVTVRTLHKALRDAGKSELVPRPDPALDFLDDMESTPPVVQSSPGRGLALNKAHVAIDTIANALNAVSRSPLAPAFDELKQQVVFKAPKLPWNEAYGRTLDDNTCRLVRHYLLERHKGVDYQPSKDNAWEAVTTLAYESKFNPVLDYLDSLSWDGVSRIERLFPAYFGTEDDDYAKAVSRCFMVAAVRRQRKPGCKFDTMPVLKGRQGGGKSTGIKALFGTDWFSDADMGDLASKDAALLLNGIWVQEFAELDGMRRAEANTLKAFCSRSVDRVRPPYGKGVVEMHRRCVFIGTVNEGGYLLDSTGNRRFWPLTVSGEIDVEALRRDRDQLWAEAAAMEASGSPDTLDRTLWAHAADRQAGETSEDPWADILRGLLADRADDAVDCLLAIGEFGPGGLRQRLEALPADRIHTGELLEALGIPKERQTKAAAQKLRTVMEGALGWTYGRSVRVGGKIGAGYKAPGS